MEKLRYRKCWKVYCSGWSLNTKPSCNKTEACLFPTVALSVVIIIIIIIILLLLFYFLLLTSTKLK